MPVLGIDNNQNANIIKIVNNHIVSLIMSDFFIHNPWWSHKEAILNDHKLKELGKSSFIWKPSLFNEFNHNVDAIYTLRGPRQIGKTTLLKTLIKRLLLEENIEPENILFYSCDLIENFKELAEVLLDYLNARRLENQDRIYVFLDEISSVECWQKAIKYLADLGVLQNVTAILTGSHAIDIKNYAESMPGRRGNVKDLDKTILPLSFKEFLELQDKEIGDFSLEALVKKQNNIFKLKTFYPALKAQFKNYLLTGGFPQIINEYLKTKDITDQSYDIYTRWVLSDLQKTGKQERVAGQIINQIIKTLSSSISWHTLAKESEISTHNTIINYVNDLERLFLLKPMFFYDIDQHKTCYKKNKKVYFADNFSFAAFYSWLITRDGYITHYLNLLQNQYFITKLAEQNVFNKLCREPADIFFTNINNKEIDFILKTHDKIIPVEVKYQNKIVPFDIKHLLDPRFKNSIIVSKKEFTVIENKLLILPLEAFLLLDF